MDELVFPALGIREMALTFTNNWEGPHPPQAIVKRPVRGSDPNMTIGFSEVDWVPIEHSIGLHEPSRGRYLVSVQAYNKHGDEEEGISIHAAFTKNLRAMLYRSAALRIRLGGLSETSMGVTERATQWGVRQTRYLSNEINHTFSFVSSTQFWIETESIGV